MNIAVTYEAGRVFQHFGQTKQFKVYSVENGTVMTSEVRSAGDSRHGALADLLASWGVSTLLCGGIGAGAKSALAQSGIALYGGVEGDSDEQLQAFLRGDLRYNPDIQCTSHKSSHSSCGKHRENE